MRALIVLSIAVLTAGSKLDSQSLGIGATGGVGSTASGAGVAARVVLAKEMRIGLSGGLELTYLAQGAADTTSPCDIVSCLRSAHLSNAIQLGALLTWRAAPDGGFAAWVGPYIGRWLSCVDAFNPSANPVIGTLDSAGEGRPAWGAGWGCRSLGHRAAAASRWLGGRRLGVALRYALGILPSVQLGSQSDVSYSLRPSSLSVFMVLESGLD